MKDLGITKGEWKVTSSANFSGEYYVINKQGLPTFGEDKANAKLIADAGTTANKCGLLPSELLRQRDELLGALRITLVQIHDGEVPTATIAQIEQVINKVKK